MSFVRFAELCDRCGKRSEEYSGWPTCRECSEDICPDCAVPGSISDPDVDAPSRCVCIACQEYDAEPDSRETVGGPRWV